MPGASEWIIIGVAVLLVAATVVFASLAVTDKSNRRKYVKWSVLLGLATLMLALVSLFFRQRATGDFKNDYVEDVGADTFVGSLVASISK